MAIAGTTVAQLVRLQAGLLVWYHYLLAADNGTSGILGLPRAQVAATSALARSGSSSRTSG